MKQETNIESGAVKEFLMEKFWTVLMCSHRDDITGRLDWTANELSKMVQETYDAIPTHVKEFINKRDLDFIKDPEICVEVTTKKKGKVIYTDFYHKDLLNTFIEIPEKYLDRVYYKQLLHGWLSKEYGFQPQYTKPKKTCCNAFKHQFTYCEGHGLKCPDWFLRCNLNGEIYVNAENATYALSNCPFCGKKLNRNKGTRRGRVLECIIPETDYEDKD